MTLVEILLPRARPAILIANGEAEHPVAFSSSDLLSACITIGNQHLKSNQEMHMVPHNDITVEIVVAKRIHSAMHQRIEADL
jgi:hypothetical protein